MDCLQIFVLKNQGFSDVYKGNGNELIRSNLLKFQQEYEEDFYELGLFAKLFHDGGRYLRETSPLICGANQWIGSYIITASVMKELR